MITRLLTFAAALAFAGLAAAPAPAQTAPPPTLRSAVTVSSELVRLGDLLDNAGPAALEPVFRAPDLGTTGTVQAARVVAAARDKGVAVVDTKGVAEVSVTRASRVLSLDAIKAAITLTLIRQNGLGDDADLAVGFDPGARAVHIEPGAGAPLQVVSINWNPTSGRFDATLSVEGSSVLARMPLRIGGQAVETVAVPVFARAVGRGEVVRAADVVIDRLPRSQAVAGTIDAPAQAIGQAVRRTVRPGQPVLAGDLTKPNLVTRNDTVTLTYEVPSMVLTVRAKALDTGAEGDSIPVLNTQSNRIVQATVTGPGHVTVTVPARVALN
ncbi:flagellar basal body P-ring formation chaperone FlgA [Labrys wisconsinensis]|uniref:Flagella basal body P-ring formation protein FlgA n=1 Tax=Labrys wisconsinensis TaxID=425677 RepID=A0ABU0JDF5_9HYPH|nr:flagellar basal body P-ring formation chaperone FlgA [Labrys wisconsinensis]MDQ0471433.1 flagella basal body P-ring formation protein FlgA [Labrys wisconsinensis]